MDASFNLYIAELCKSQPLACPKDKSARASWILVRTGETSVAYVAHLIEIADNMSIADARGEVDTILAEAAATWVVNGASCDLVLRTLPCSIEAFSKQYTFAQTKKLNQEEAAYNDKRQNIEYLIAYAKELKTIHETHPQLLDGGEWMSVINRLRTLLEKLYVA